MLARVVLILICVRKTPASIPSRVSECRSSATPCRFQELGLKPTRAARPLFDLCMAIDASRIKAISLDVTGTLLVHRYPIMETYAAAAVWAKLPNPPTAEELKPAFKKAKTI